MNNLPLNSTAYVWEGDWKNVESDIKVGPNFSDASWVTEIKHCKSFTLQLTRRKKTPTRFKMKV